MDEQDFRIRDEIQRRFSDPDVHQRLAEEFHIELALLFGSGATGTMRRDSDLDLAVLLARSLNRTEEEALVTYLRGLTGFDRVDVVCLNDASYALRYEVSLQGVLLYERNDDGYADFVTRTFKEYEELTFLNRYYHQMKIEELKKFADGQS